MTCSRWLSIAVFVAAAGWATAQTNSVVMFNADRVLVLNGQRKFTIGFSPGPPTGGVTPTGRDALQELREAGGLLLRMTQSTDWSNTVISNQQAVLDWAATNGMFIWLNLREKSKFAAGDTNTEAYLRSLVTQFKNHPALGLWKNLDESFWGNTSAADLQRGFDVIHQEDTNHPVVQTHAPRGTVAELQPYNVALDVLALDIYPVGVPPGANSTNVNKEISMVGDFALFLDTVGNHQKPFWMIEQIAWSGVTPPGKTLVFPTFRQERYMAYQAIILGARGLMYFGGNIAATLNAQDASLGWNWTFWNDVLKPVVLEIGDQSPLAGALVASNSTLPVTMSGTVAPDLEFCVREVPGFIYILASKREGATTNVTFSGLPSWATNGEVLYEAPRTVSATGGQFTDTFAPFDVHVYRFAQTNVAPGMLAPPASRTNYESTTTIFHVTAFGTGPLAFQWRRNNTNLTNGGNLTGATTPTLTLTNLALADAGNYSVVVSGFGSVTSAPAATLTVLSQTNQPPVIVSQPQNVTTNAGGGATFSVTATPAGGLGYAWSKNGLPLVNGGNVSGANTATLTLNGVLLSDAGSYTATVSNGAGTTNSAAATLSVVYPLPYYDPFNYTAGANLAGNTNGNLLSWADIGTSTAGPYVTVRSNSLAVPGLANASGNSIQFGGLGKSVRFSFPTGNPVTTGTLYYSFTTQVIDTNGLAASGIFVAGFNNSVGTQTGQPTVIGTRVYLHHTNGGFNVGTSKNSSTASEWVWDPRNFTTNQVLFLVGSYTFNTLATNNDDVAQLWINPDPATFGAGAPPPPSLIASNGTDISANQIASFIFVQRSATQPAVMFADELRLGRTWADVTPPVTITLTDVTRLGGGAFQFRYLDTGGLNLNVFASTNLTQWSALGAATLISPGVYQFTDATATNYARRFYQVRSN
ncbi:MAG: hypothetical protein EXS35_17430 [Pedosphaera sp.]|nr:hypothetical protein [Pedosphaera sp.]